MYCHSTKRLRSGLHTVSLYGVVLKETVLTFKEMEREAKLLIQEQSQEQNSVLLGMRTTRQDHLFTLWCNTRRPILLPAATILDKTSDGRRENGPDVGSASRSTCSLGQLEEGAGVLLCVQEKLAQWCTCCAHPGVLRRCFFSQKRGEGVEIPREKKKNVSLCDEL